MMYSGKTVAEVAFVASSIQLLVSLKQLSIYRRETAYFYERDRCQIKQVSFMWVNKID